MAESLSGTYPRVYRASGGWLIGLSLCGVLLLSVGIWVAWLLANAPGTHPQARVWLTGLCLAIAALGIYCLLSTFRSTVVLYPDRIEIVELTHTAVLAREEIRGGRLLSTSPSGLVLEPKDESRPKVKIALIFREDAEFQNWVYTLPSLDREDIRTAKAEVRNDPRLGETPGERMKAVAKGRRFAKRLTILTAFALLWGFIPIFYPLAMLCLASLPWIAVAIVKRSAGLFRINTTVRDAHPNVALPYLFPGVVLLYRGVADFNVIVSPRLIWLVVGIAALLWFSAVTADRTLRGKFGTLLALAGFTLAHGYGLAIETNVWLDRSPGTTYRVPVEGKHISRGKGTR